MTLLTSAASVFRDFVGDGIPATGPHEPVKAEIRALFAERDAVLNAYLSAGGLIYDTRSNLYADLAHAANTQAWVIQDSTVAYNGIYRKAGASGAGSWSRVADLPYSFIKLTDAGAGTANAIVATSDIPLPAAAFGAVLVMNVYEANTGNVTVAANGASAKSLLTNSGNEIASGGLVSGALIAFVDDGTNFRLLSDQASAAIQAAAEAAQAGAETARDTTEGYRDQTLGYRNEAAAYAAASAQKMFPVRVVDTGGGAPATDYEAGDTIDGVTLAEGDFVLRATASGNAADGVYLVPASGAAARADQFNTFAELAGAGFRVMEGSANADTLWFCNSDQGGTIGVTAVLIEEFEGGGGASSAATIAVLEAMTAESGLVVYLAQTGRAGWFVFDASDLSTEVTADTQQGIYIAPSSDDTGASGAWVRQYTGDANIMWWGAVGDAIVATDGAITASGTTFTSAGASFTAADVGKFICIGGAGAAGVVLRTTIASVTNGTTVEVANAASTTVSGATYHYGTDNTTAYNGAIAILANGTGIRWPFNGGIWAGHFAPAAHRTFKLDGGGNRFTETADTAPVVRMGGDMASHTTLSSNVVYGEIVLPLTTSAGLSVDDLILLEDDTVEPVGGVTKNNQELLCIQEVVDGTSVEVHDKVRSNQNTGTKAVYLLTPIVGPEVRNFKFEITHPGINDTHYGPCQLNYARDPVVKNVTTRNSRGEGIYLRYCYDYRVQNCAVFDGFNKASSGNGYGVSIYASRKGDLRRIRSRNTRNGIDFSGCYDASVDGFDIEDCNYGIALAHVIHGGYFRVRHGKITRIATGGYAVGNSAVTAGLSNPQNHVFRDTIVQDLAYSFDEAADVTNDKPGVWFQSSISNCHAINIEASYRRGGSISVENAVIVRLEGFALGICVFEKIATEAYYNDGNHGVGWCVHCKLAGSASTLGSDSIGLLVVRDCYNRYGQGVLKGEGLKNVHSQNLTMSFSPGTAIKSLSTAHSVANVVDSTAGVLAVV